MRSLVGILGAAIVLAVMLTALGLVGSENHAAALTWRPDKEEVRQVPGKAADSCAAAPAVAAAGSVAC